MGDSYLNQLSDGVTITQSCLICREVAVADTSTMTGYFVLHHWHFGPMIAKICCRSLRGSNHGGACKDTD